MKVVSPKIFSGMERRSKAGGFFYPVTHILHQNIFCTKLLYRLNIFLYNLISDFGCSSFIPTLKIFLSKNTPIISFFSLLSICFIHHLHLILLNKITNQWVPEKYQTCNAKKTRNPTSRSPSDSGLSETNFPESVSKSSIEEWPLISKTKYINFTSMVPSTTPPPSSRSSTQPVNQSSTTCSRATTVPFSYTARQALAKHTQWELYKQSSARTRASSPSH